MLKHIKHWHVKVGVTGQKPDSLTAFQYHEDAVSELADCLRGAVALGGKYYFLYKTEATGAVKYVDQDFETAWGLEIEACFDPFCTLPVHGEVPNN